MGKSCSDCPPLGSVDKAALLSTIRAGAGLKLILLSYGWIMEINRKTGYLIISASVALLVLCAISSRWYVDGGYLLAFLNNAGIYVYETRGECGFCNMTIYSPGGVFFGGWFCWV